MSCVCLTVLSLVPKEATDTHMSKEQAESLNTGGGKTWQPLPSANKLLPGLATHTPEPVSSGVKLKCSAELSGKFLPDL